MGERPHRCGALSSTVLADGRTARAAIRVDGPAGLGIDVWFTAEHEAGGSRLHDMVWDTGRCGAKVVSRRLAELLTRIDPTVCSVEVDLRDRRGGSIGGYVVVLETVGEPTPVHSMRRTSRGSGLVVSERVREAVRAAGCTGLCWEQVADPFPV